MTVEESLQYDRNHRSYLRTKKGVDVPYINYHYSGSGPDVRYCECGNPLKKVNGQWNGRKCYSCRSRTHYWKWRANNPIKSKEKSRIGTFCIICKRTYKLGHHSGRVCPCCLSIRYARKNPEKVREWARIRQRKVTAELRDSVVKERIKYSIGIEVPSQELISIWRETLLVKRAVRKVKEALDERSI